MATSHLSELHPISRPLAQCPACASERLELVVEIEREEVHFHCGNCGRCWHVELGFVHLVPAGACHHHPS